ELETCQLAQRHTATDRSSDQNVTEFFDLIPVVLIKPDKNVESALAFEYLCGRISADRDLCGFKHIGNVQAISRKLRAIKRHLEGLLASHLFYRKVLTSANVRHRIANLFGKL